MRARLFRHRYRTPHPSLTRLQGVRSFALLGEHFPPRVMHMGSRLPELITTPPQLHVLVSWTISLGGVAYWYWWVVWLPRRGGYVLVRDWVRDDDGSTRSVIRKVKGGPPDSSLEQSENFEHHPPQPAVCCVGHRRPRLSVEIPSSTPPARHQEFLVGPSIPTPRHLHSTPFASSFPSEFLQPSSCDTEQDLVPGNR